MKKYPFVKQRGVKDCGPACVLMILKYYGGYVSIDKLSEMLCTNSNGTTAYHIVDVLNSLGFDSNGYYYNNLSEIKVPSIMHINKNSYKHYVIIWEINFRKKIVIIGDPSNGNIKMSFNDFLQIWTGNTIEMIQISKVPKEMEVNPLKFILGLIKINIKKILFIFFFSILSVLCALTLSFFIQGIVNSVITNSFNILLLFAFIIVFNIIFEFIRNKLLINLSESIDKTLFLDTFIHITLLPYRLCRIKTTGEIISYYSDLSIIKNLIIKLSTSLFIDFPIILIILLYFYNISKHLFIISLFIISLYFILYSYYKKKIYYLSDEVFRKKALLHSYITETVSGYETVKNLNAEGKIINTFKNKYNLYNNSYKIINKNKNIENTIKNLIGGVSNIVFMLYGYLNISKGLPSDMFITLYMLLSLLLSSIENILNYNLEYRDVKSAITHIGELNIEKDKKIIGKINGDILIKNLSFSYDRVHNVLNNINIMIKQSEKIMVFGKSGSGKSTLFKLLKGYYSNYNGEILVGGYDVKKYTFNNIVYVSSREILFTGRLIDNLNVRKCIRENYGICELDFANDDLIIEENGFNLSSGQSQRISLARALSNFDIIIIDEGLSDVDTNMERRIIKRMFKEHQDKTIIYISHRLDNLDLFDRLLNMDKGEVISDSVRCER